MTAPILVISGCSGVGKSTVSRSLAGRFDSAVHLPADTFYRLFDDPWPDPESAEGARRYRAVGAAVGSAAGQLALGGYLVILDGTMFPTGADELADIWRDRGVEVHYALLRAPLEVCLARARTRDPEFNWDLRAFEALHARYDRVALPSVQRFDAAPGPDEVTLAVEAAFRTGRLQV
ncbi:MAG TPA: AAA family ATPase [Acidimicrobiales bacterium]|nr:AAA family ATPase [Acidimicrobiales bacterium]